MENTMHFAIVELGGAFDGEVIAQFYLLSMAQRYCDMMNKYDNRANICVWRVIGITEYGKEMLS